MKLTPWFPANVKPVRAGVYEVESLNHFKLYRYWDGRRWRAGAHTPDRAIQKFRISGLPSPDVVSWRGLAEE